MSRRLSASRVLLTMCSFAVLLIAATQPATAQFDQTVYDDALQNGWENWSWATVNLANPTPVHNGSSSISVSAADWQALYLHHASQDGSSFSSLQFWVHGGSTGGQSVQLQATRAGVPQTAVILPALPANTWRLEDVPLSSLGVDSATDFDGFWLQIRQNGAAPTFYVDDIVLIGATNQTVNPVVISVDAALNQRPINPMIYGVAFATSTQLNDLNAPLHRSGGNAESRYNWQINAHNRAADWYFQSLADSPATAGAEADEHIAASLAGGADPMITMPLLGWAPKLGPNRQRLSSFSIAKYGPQTDNDWQWFPDAGNGISAWDGQPNHRERSERRQLPGRRNLPARLGGAPDQPVGAGGAGQRTLVLSWE